MSRKSRRKKFRKGTGRLSPEERVMQLIEDGQWRTISEIQESSSVKLVVVRRIVSRNQIENSKVDGVDMYRLIA